MAPLRNLCCSGRLGGLMPKAAFNTPKQSDAIGHKPDPGYPQKVQLLPTAAHRAGLPANVFDVQLLVPEKLLERDPLPPVSQENPGQVGEVAKLVAAQQQFLILRQPGALLVSPTA